MESEPVLISLHDRKRANLAKIATADHYLVRSEPNGTLIWEPAEIVSVLEQNLLKNENLMNEIATDQADPSRLRRRDRSTSPRDVELSG